MDAFVKNKIDGKIFHGRIEKFLDNFGDTVDFIDEKDITFFQMRQKPHEIAALFQSRP